MVLDVGKSYDRQASKEFYNKCSKNSSSQIVFRTDIFRKLTLGAPITTNALKDLCDVHLSVQGWKARFRIAPSSSRCSQTNAHRAGFKSRTRQAETQRFPIIPLHLKSVQNSKRKTSNNIEKSSIRSSTDSYASRHLLLSDWMIVSCQPIREQQTAADRTSRANECRFI